MSWEQTHKRTRRAFIPDFVWGLALYVVEIFSSSRHLWELPRNGRFKHSRTASISVVVLEACGQILRNLGDFMMRLPAKRNTHPKRTALRVSQVSCCPESHLEKKHFFELIKLDYNALTGHWSHHHHNRVVNWDHPVESQLIKCWNCLIWWPW